MNRKLYEELASLVDAYHRCVSTKNTEWEARHLDRLKLLVDDNMPSGSGFDNGTKLDVDASNADKLVFTTAYHHMDEGGGYDGWTDHTVTVKPSLVGGFNLKISGRNRNDIKDYIGETFQHALTLEVEPR